MKKKQMVSGQKLNLVKKHIIALHPAQQDGVAGGASAVGGQCSNATGACSVAPSCNNNCNSAAPPCISNATGACSVAQSCNNNCNTAVAPCLSNATGGC